MISKLLLHGSAQIQMQIRGYPQTTFTIKGSDFLHILPKNCFLCKYARVFQLRMIFTDFWHMFTLLKLEIGLGKFFFFGKSDFFPKIPNFCRIGLAPAKTYWMIMSPQKRVKKIPTICTCQTFIYYVNLLKTNFEVIFKTHFRAKKISKIIMDP